MPFDVEQAQKDGVPEDAILQHLTATRPNFDVAGELKDGATKSQIIGYLAKAPAADAAPAQSVSQRASANLDPTSGGNQQSDRIIANAGQDEKNLYGRFAKDAALGVGAIAAAPLTGGMSLLPALLTSAGVGAAASGLGTGIQSFIGSNETPKTAKQLALSMGFDAASFATGEGVGRGVGAIATSLLPKFAAEEAGKVAGGRNTLLRMYGEGSTALDNEIARAATATGQTPTVSIDGILQRADARLAALPKQTTATGSLNAGLSDAAQQQISAITQDLGVSGGKAVDTPVQSAIEMYHGLNQQLYPGTQFTARERVIFRDALGELDGAIKSKLGQLSPEAADMYQTVNGLVKAEKAGRETLNLANLGVKTLLKTVGVPVGAGGVGAGLGYLAGGQQGAEIGGAAGVAAGAASPVLSAYILKQVFAHPDAAPLMKSAVDTFLSGKTGPATALAARAISMAGGRKTIRDWMEQQPQNPGAISQIVAGSMPNTQPDQSQ